jgi:hypothetical protein
MSCLGMSSRVKSSIALPGQPNRPWIPGAPNRSAIPRRFCWSMACGDRCSSLPERCGSTKAATNGAKCVVDQVILTVMGVWPDGQHQVIQYQLAAAEDTAAWSAQLAALLERGIDAAAVQMVVSDGSTGLPAALATHIARRQTATLCRA